MGGNDHAFSFFFHTEDKLTHIARCDNIQAVRRLVEDDKIRIMDNGDRQRDFLSHALRELADFRVRELVDTECREQLLLSRFGLLLRNVIQSREIFKHVIGGRFLIELQIRRQEREMVLDLDRIGLDAFSVIKDISRVRFDERREHSHRCRLTCTVRSQKSENLSGMCGEADIIYRDLFSVRQVLRASLRFTEHKGFAQILCFQRMHKFALHFIILFILISISKYIAKFRFHKVNFL